MSSCGFECGCLDRQERSVAGSRQAHHGMEVTDLTSSDGRALEVFKVVSVAGEPSVYLMGKKVLG